MLQPSQLVDVSSKYPDDIVELRSFLAKAGLPLTTSSSLAELAHRVHNDKAFRRDLTAHLWVATEGSDRDISFADLLGILAIAAAGVQYSAQAEQQDTLTLLRFLKEARIAELKNSPSRREQAPAHGHPTPAITRSASNDVHTGTDLPASDVILSAREARLHRYTPESPIASDRNGARWWIAGACAMALLALLWFFHRTSSSQRQPDQQATNQAAMGPAQPGPTPPSSFAHATPSQRMLGEATISVPRKPNQPHPPLRPTTSATQPQVPDQPHAAEGPAPTPVSSTPATLIASSSSPAPILRAPANVPSAAVNSAPHTSPRSAGTDVVQASILSKRIGARPLPDGALSATPDEAPDKARRPKLLRRHPLTATQDTDLVAGLQPLDTPTRGGSSAPQSSSAHGVVRPTALGTMAANLMYSPAPAYPPAAATAHVSGEVQVQAQVDRDGTVTYARVVSGPPLLRSAALAAMQQWRYRPYLAHGKPVPTTALAIMDFQLP